MIDRMSETWLAVESLINSEEQTALAKLRSLETPDAETHAMRGVLILVERIRRLGEPRMQPKKLEEGEPMRNPVKW